MSGVARSARRAGVVGALLLIQTGCGFQFLERFDGAPAAADDIAAPADVLWDQLLAGVEQAELTVSRKEPGTRSIQLDWLTPPGDGRQYLTCAGTSTVIGTASVLPRISIRANAGASRITVASVVRATGAESCRSTGRFESWLLSHLGIAGSSGNVASAASAAPPP